MYRVEKIRIEDVDVELAEEFCKPENIINFSFEIKEEAPKKKERTVKQEKSTKRNKKDKAKTEKSTEATKVVELEPTKKNYDLNKMLDGTRINGIVTQNIERTPDGKFHVTPPKKVSALKYEFPYKENQLLTNAEWKLYNLMLKELIWQGNKFGHRVSIAIKPRLADIMEVDDVYSTNNKDFYSIAMKHIDFVIFDNQHNQVICGVELFDYTHHDNEQTKESDKFKENAFKVIDKPLIIVDKLIAEVTVLDLRPINDAIANHFSVYYRCPICNSTVTMHRSTRGKNKGHMFYGCDKHPECTGTINID